MLQELELKLELAAGGQDEKMTVAYPLKDWQARYFKNMFNNVGYYVSWVNEAEALQDLGWLLVHLTILFIIGMILLVSVSMLLIYCVDGIFRPWLNGRHVPESLAFVLVSFLSCWTICVELALAFFCSSLIMPRHIARQRQGCCDLSGCSRSRSFGQGILHVACG